MGHTAFAPAPAWQISQWFNSERALSLADFRGRVIALHAFQMLCPGCVQQGLPQAARIARLFDPARVAVVGLQARQHHVGVQCRVTLDSIGLPVQPQFLLCQVLHQQASQLRGIEVLKTGQKRGRSGVGHGQRLLGAGWCRFGKSLRKFAKLANWQI